MVIVWNQTVICRYNCKVCHRIRVYLSRVDQGRRLDMFYIRLVLVDRSDVSVFIIIVRQVWVNITYALYNDKLSLRFVLICGTKTSWLHLLMIKVNVFQKCNLLLKTFYLLVTRWFQYNLNNNKSLAIKKTFSLMQKYIFGKFR